MAPNDDPPDGRPDRKWTVMVFMVADQVEGFEPLFEAADDDLKEMNRVTSNDNMDLFVQLHRDGTATRRRFGSGESDPKPVHPDEQSRGAALTAFVRWAFQQRPPADDRYSMLVLWGHAYQFAMLPTETPQGRIEALDFARLVTALESVQKEVTHYGTTTLDIIGFDACDLATVEVAVQLQPFAKFLLASEMGIPIPGWPYDRIFDRLQYPKGPKGSLMGPAELGSYIVRRFCEAYKSDTPVSLTLLDLSKAIGLGALAERLARCLAVTMDERPEERELIRALFTRSQTQEDKPFVDVADLCLNLVRECSDVFTVEAARKVGDYLITPGPVNPHQSIKGGGRPFVQEHGRNAGETAKLNGVSLYAPHVAQSYDFEAARPAYQKLAFAEQSLWNRLVHVLAQ
jgi:hypothetical protein